MKLREKGVELRRIYPTQYESLIDWVEGGGECPVKNIIARFVLFEYESFDALRTLAQLLSL